MHPTLVQALFAAACFGSALATDTPYNPNEPPPPPTVPQGPTPSGTPQGGCCGYIVSNRNGAYWRYKHEIDFSALSSIDSVFTSGWEVSNRWQVGGANPSTGRRAMAEEDNVQLIRGEGLRMKVPAQSRDARSFSVAEVQFPDVFLGGTFEITAKVTGVSGTLMSFMTYHADDTTHESTYLNWQDAQSVEMQGSSLLKASGTSPVGMNMVHYEAKSGARVAASQTFPSGVNPSTSFNTYSTSWYPNVSGGNTARMTEYRFNGKLLNGPKQYSAVNSQILLFQHWTNGDPNWMGFPPTQDAYLTIKKVVAYYDRPIKLANGAGISKDTCKREKACTVTV